MKKKWKRIIVGTAVLAILGMIVSQSLQPLRLELLEMKKREIAQTFTEEGLVRAEKETPVYTQYGGKVLRIPVEEGDQVKAGDLLATFDSQELLSQLQSLQAQRRSIEAQKDLQELNLDLEAKKLLWEAGAISQKEFEDAKNSIDSGYYPALIAAVNAQIDQLDYQIAQCNAVAPVSGEAAEIQIKEGMVVSPSAPLLTIFSGDAYRVEVYVLADDASRLQPQAEVRLIQESPAGDIVFPGTVEQIAPAAVEKVSALGLSEQRLKVIITPQSPPDLLLRPGYELEVEFTPDKQENQLVVPKTAVFSYQDGDAVWVVRKGKASVQPIGKGFENVTEIAVTEGLRERDLVVLDPQAEGLKEGKTIKPLTD